MFFRFKITKQKILAILVIPMAFLSTQCAEDFDPPVVEVEQRKEKAFVASGDGTVAVITHGDTPKHVKTVKPVGSNDVTAAFGHVYVNNSGENSVAIIDANKEVLKGTITVGERPVHSLMVKEGNLLLVGNDGPRNDPDTTADDILVAQDDSISVIDTNPNSTTFMMEIARIRVGNGHHKLAFSDTTERAAITNLSAGTVTVIDINGLSVLCTVKVGAGASPVPHGIDYSDKSGHAYIANVSGGDTEAITIINLDAAITVPTNPHETGTACSAAFDLSSITRGTGAGQIPASGFTHANHDGTFIFTVGYVGGTQTGHVSVIRTSDNAVVSVLPLSNFKPDKFAITETNDRMYVSSVQDEDNATTVIGNRVAVIDIDTITGFLTPNATPFLTVGVGHDHRAITLSSDDLRLFVPNSGEDPGTVSVFDTATLTLLGTFVVGDEPNTLTYVDENTLKLPEGGAGGGGHGHS